ncbi:MAG TPA: hypothetical protein VFV07_13960, partial [Rhizomicrobium sp.]|nr:hypothetical protein [Rhizomicrobium sp.]
LHTVFGEVRELHGFGLSLAWPVLASIRWPTLILALAAAVAIFRFKAGMIPTFAACSAAGILYYLVMGFLGLGNLVQL